MPDFYAGLKAINRRLRCDFFEGVVTSNYVLVLEVGQIALELFESLFDFGKLKVVFPKFCRVIAAEVRAQQIASFAPPVRAEFFTIQAVSKGGGLFFPIAVDEDLQPNVASVASGFLFCRAEGLVELVTSERYFARTQVGTRASCTTRTTCASSLASEGMTTRSGRKDL